MKRQLYSIRDSKAEAYDPPFAYNTDQEAIRAFSVWSNDQKGKIGMFPEDHDLYCIGTFDYDSGKIEPHSAPQHLVKAQNLVQAKTITQTDLKSVQ